MAPGILWVSSRISPPPQPRPDVDPLTPDKFCDWYENTHIQEVTALPGVPTAARYEASTSNPHHTSPKPHTPSALNQQAPQSILTREAQPQPSAQTWSSQAPWLTVYEMPDVAYRTSQAFRGLDGQSAPRETLLRGVFEQARFDTRFYALTYASSSSFSSSSLGDAAPLLVSWASDTADTCAAALEKIEGVSRVRAFRLEGASTLERFERRDALAERSVGRGLVLAEFEEGALRAVMEKVHSGALDEVGWYRLKRVYD